MVLAGLAIAVVPPASAQAAACPSPTAVSHPLAPYGAPDQDTIEGKPFCPSAGYDLTEGDAEAILAAHARADFIDQAEGQIACAPEVDCGDLSDDVDWVGDTSTWTGTGSNPPAFTAYIHYYANPDVLPGQTGYTCQYYGTFRGQTGTGNYTASYSTRSCRQYTQEASKPWEAATETMPPTGRAHRYEDEDCHVECDETPLRFVGNAEKLAAEEYAKPDWVANVHAWDGSSYYAGSSKSTGSPGNWDVYVNVYRDGHTCEYRATVSGDEDDPTVTPVGYRICTDRVSDWCLRYIPSYEGKPQGSAPSAEWLDYDGQTFDPVDPYPCTNLGPGPWTQSNAEFTTRVENLDDFGDRAEDEGYISSFPPSQSWIGTSDTYQDSGGDWHVKMISYVSPSASSITGQGYYCIYQSIVSGTYQDPEYEAVGTPECHPYFTDVPSVGWSPTPLEPLPPTSAAHNWEPCSSSCSTRPLRFVGNAERLVAQELAQPHWNTHVAPWDQYSSYVGSTKSSGTPGDWDVYINVYRLYDPAGGAGVNCEYHASVTGTEDDPVLTPLWGSFPTCTNFADEATEPWSPAPLTPLPPTGAAHNWKTCTSSCSTRPMRFLGNAERVVAQDLAQPHWISHVAPWDVYSSYVGSTKTSGYPGNWDVYVNVYRLYDPAGGHGVNCEYHASVTGTENAPTVTPLWGSFPTCTSF